MTTKQIQYQREINFKSILRSALDVDQNWCQDSEHKSFFFSTCSHHVGLDERVEKDWIVRNSQSWTHHNIHPARPFRAGGCGILNIIRSEHIITLFPPSPPIQNMGWEGRLKWIVSLFKSSGSNVCKIFNEVLNILQIFQKKNIFYNWQARFNTN